MLYLDISELARHGVEVSGVIDPHDPLWRDMEIVPSGDVLVSGRVSTAGGGRYYFTGRIRGEASEVCTRCLEPVVVPVSEDVRAIFAEPGTDGADDPDVYPVDPGPGTLDLRPAVREQWILSVPRFVLCSADCKGLCPTCGENLNIATCSCKPPSDSRWDVLRSAFQQ